MEKVVKKTKCSWCGKEMPITEEVIELFSFSDLDLNDYEEECIGCWDLRQKIETNPDCARKILAHVTQWEGR